MSTLGHVKLTRLILRPSPKPASAGSKSGWGVLGEGLARPIYPHSLNAGSMLISNLVPSKRVRLPDWELKDQTENLLASLASHSTPKGCAFPRWYLVSFGVRTSHFFASDLYAF